MKSFSLTPDQSIRHSPHDYLPTNNNKPNRLMRIFTVNVFIVLIDIWRRRRFLQGRDAEFGPTIIGSPTVETLANYSAFVPTAPFIQIDGIDDHPPPSIAFDDKRMIITLSMGMDAAGTTLVERCHRSVRGPGEFKGYFAVLTDAPDGRYAELMAKDDRFFVLQAKEEDKIKDINPTLTAKFFKTLFIDYVYEVRQLKSVDFFIYVDFDILLGSTVIGYESMIMERRLADQKEYYKNHPGAEQGISIMYHFEEIDGDSKRQPYHTGVISFDRWSGRCMKLWGVEIVENMLPHQYTISDQDALARLSRKIDSGNVTGCKLVAIPRSGYILFPFTQSMLRREKAPFIHVTNSYRSGKIPEEVQNQYFSYILGLESNVTFYSKRVGIGKNEFA